ALLDVILILLFLVILQISRQSEKAAAEFERREEALQEQMTVVAEERDLALAAAEMDGDQLTAYDIFVDQTDLVAIQLRMSGANVIPLISINGEDVPGIQHNQELRDYLIQRVDQLDQPVVVVILAYDNNRILWRDYQAYSRQILAMRADTTKTILYREVPLFEEASESASDSIHNVLPLETMTTASSTARR
ncbi:MAG TPA: hypothetical protein GX717_08220, partial [Clostridiaceae bacterium]|nr:hypothetical protein [Clostridiaceae bacterium]